MTVGHRGDRPSVVMGPAFAGRLAGVVLLAGLVAALVNALTAPSTRQTVGHLLAAVALGVLAAFSLRAPWEHWGRRSTLLLLVPGLALLGAINYTVGEPYLAGVFFVVIGVWIGLGHGRFTTLALAPVLALGFWAPLAVAPHPPGLGSATVVVTLVAVTLGEALAWLVGRLERAQQDLLDAKERRFTALVQRGARSPSSSTPTGSSRISAPEPRGPSVTRPKRSKAGACWS